MTIRNSLFPALLAVFIAISTFFLTGCSGSRRDVDSITVYTALEDDEIQAYLSHFKEKHPDIGIKLVRDSTGVISAKLLAERDNPQADVVWGLALTNLLVCEEAGILAGYNPVGLEYIKEGFKDEKHDEARWVGIKAWMTGIVGNTIELKARNLNLPQSYEELADERYRGLVVMPNPASSGTGFLTISAIFQLMGEEEGWAYLDRLNRNIAMYTHSGSKPAKLAGQGEFPIGVSFAYRGFKQKAAGEPVETAFPKEGAGWELEANALVKKGRINPKAKVFLDWAISREVMDLYSKIYPLIAADIPVVVPDGYPADPASVLIENDFEWAAANRQRILEKWSARYDGKSEK